MPYAEVDFRSSPYSTRSLLFQCFETGKKLPQTAFPASATSSGKNCSVTIQNQRYVYEEIFLVSQGHPTPSRVRFVFSVDTELQFD